MKLKLTPSTKETKLKNGTHSCIMSGPHTSDARCIWSITESSENVVTNLRREEILRKRNRQWGADPHDLRGAKKKENDSDDKISVKP